MHVFELSEHRYLIRLVKGEELMEELRGFSRQHRIGAGVIRGLGAALNADLAFYLLAEKRYETFQVEEMTEVTSLIGNVSIHGNGDTIVHIHATLSRRDGSALGGHVMSLTAGATLEVDLEAFPGTLRRNLDEEIGLPLLCDLEAGNG